MWHHVRHPRQLSRVCQRRAGRVAPVMIPLACWADGHPNRSGIRVRSLKASLPKDFTESPRSGILTRLWIPFPLQMKRKYRGNT